MDISKKLQDAIDTYNDLVRKEHKLDQELAEARQERTIQHGKVVALDEVLKEELKDASVEASQIHDAEVIAEDAA